MANNNLQAVETIMKTGKEPFIFNGDNLPINVLSFWQWSTSELLGNALRGVLAEFKLLYNSSMKKLLLLLFSLIFSFNSYGQWVWSTVDVNGDKHYLDLTNIEVDEDGYFYY